MTTSLATHTPGPWILERGADHAGEWYTVRLPDTNECIYDSYSYGRTQGDNSVENANARLIAAAPDLLLQLGRIADALNAERVVHIEPGSVKARDILAVVTRAEGGVK